MGADFPMHAIHAYGLRRALHSLATNSEAVEILRRTTKDITVLDVRALFGFIEDSLAEKPEIDQHKASYQSRHLFLKFSGQLNENLTVKDCKFKTRFKCKSILMGQGRELRGPKGKPLPPPVTSNFDSLAERDSKSLKIVESQLDDVMECCRKTLDGHDAVLALIGEARRLGLPPCLHHLTHSYLFRGGQPTWQVYDSIENPSDLLRIGVFLLDKRQWHTSVRKGYFPFIRLTQMAQYCHEANPYTMGELLLSEWYLPRLVVVACAICIVVTSALNVEVLTALTLDNVQQRGSTMLLIGLKGRSAQLQDAAFSAESNNEDIDDDLRIDHPLAVRAIGLLVDNARRVKATLSLDDVALVSALSRRSRIPKYSTFNFYSALVEFWEYHGSYHVSARDLRRLCAHADLLSPGGSVFTVQALLKHADTRTTVNYINTNVVSKLLEANIMRFMNKLAATILFSTGRGGLLKQHGLSRRDVQPLLFPLSEASARPSAVDAWLKSDGSLALSLGIAEVKHCALQYAYYKKHFTKLCNDNPQRFSSVHLPRIFFCCALRRLILASPHASVLSNFEDTHPQSIS
jgi:integrase